MIKYSFIIPAYNVEEYIEKTLLSILSQESDDYEVIVVDDCSTDKTLEICNKYKSKKIKIIANSVHKGVSQSRNVAIEKSKGEYLIFVDGDDFIDKDALKNLDFRIKKDNPDCVICNFKTVMETTNRRPVNSENIKRKNVYNKSKSEVLEYIYRLRMIFAVWRFVVKSKIVKDNKIKFIENIVHEDEEWVPRMLLACNSFTVQEKPYYNYRVRNNSIMTSNDYKYKVRCLLHVCNSLLDYSDAIENDYEKEFLQRCVYKNLFQSYLNIRKNSNPLKPIKTRKYKK